MSRQDLRADVLAACREHVREDSVDPGDITSVLASVSNTVKNEDWARVAREGA